MERIIWWKGHLVACYKLKTLSCFFFFFSYQISPKRSKTTEEHTSHIISWYSLFSPHLCSYLRHIIRMGLQMKRASYEFLGLKSFSILAWLFQPQFSSFNQWTWGWTDAAQLKFCELAHFIFFISKLAHYMITGHPSRQAFKRLDNYKSRPAKSLNYQHNM